MLLVLVSLSCSGDGFGTSRRYALLCARQPWVVLAALKLAQLILEFLDFGFCPESRSRSLSARARSLSMVGIRSPVTGSCHSSCPFSHRRFRFKVGL